MSAFFPVSGFKRINPKKCDLNKYTSNSSKGCVLQIDLECPKDLLIDYPLAPIKQKSKMLFKYQLMIADFYNVPISNVKKLVLNFFDKGKYVLQYKNLQLYLRLGLKLKNIQRALEFNQSKNKS